MSIQQANAAPIRPLGASPAPRTIEAPTLGLRVVVTPLRLHISERACAEALARAEREDATVHHRDRIAGFNRGRGMRVRLLRDVAQAEGWFGSDAHVEWSRVAEARSGGSVSAETFRHLVPYGGKPGGAHAARDGRRLKVHSVVAHDTDWALGRYFAAGPLRALAGAQAEPDSGFQGLSPLDHECYTRPRKDWVMQDLPKRGLSAPPFSLLKRLVALLAFRPTGPAV